MHCDSTVGLHSGLTASFNSTDWIYSFPPAPRNGYCYRQPLAGDVTDYSAERKRRLRVGYGSRQRVVDAWRGAAAAPSAGPTRTARRHRYNDNAT